MKILLDRDEVYKLVEDVTNDAIEKRQHKATIQKSLVYELSLLEPVEAEPVKHGHWLRNPNNQSVITCACSECGRAVYNLRPEKIYKFCFNCGARMDGGAE